VGATATPPTPADRASERPQRRSGRRSAYVPYRSGPKPVYCNHILVIRDRRLRRRQVNQGFRRAVGTSCRHCGSSYLACCRWRRRPAINGRKETCLWSQRVGVTGRSGTCWDVQGRPTLGDNAIGTAVADANSGSRAAAKRQHSTSVIRCRKCSKHIIWPGLCYTCATGLPRQVQPETLAAAEPAPHADDAQVLPSNAD
jgi:hypothetical protein